MTLSEHAMKRREDGLTGDKRLSPSKEEPVIQDGNWRMRPNSNQTKLSL